MMADSDRTRLVLFGFQLTISGGNLAFVAASAVMVVVAVLLGLAISGFGLIGSGGLRPRS